MDGTLARLKFISRVKSGEKIDVASLTVLSGSLFSRLHRSLFGRGESRETTLQFVSDTIASAMKHIDSISEPDRQKLRTILINALKQSIAGIESLIDTYKDDRMFVSKVETMISLVGIRLGEFDAEKNEADPVLPCPDPGFV